MSTRPPLGCSVPSMVQRYLGTEYDKVKLVADNIEYVKGVATGIEGLPVRGYIGSTPPTKPLHGVEWYCTTDGRTYVWYVDDDSGQWVESSPQSTIETDPSIAHTVVTNTDNIFALWKRSAAEAGYNLVDGSFEEGGVLTSSNDVLLHKNSKNIYAWTDVFPKVVPAGSTPATSGGIDAGAWVDRTDVTLRSELGDKPLVFSFLLKTYPDHNDAFEYALSTNKTLIIDQDITLTRSITKSENTQADIVCINGAKIIGIGYAPRLRSNPEHRLSGTARRVFYPYRVGDTRHETAMSIDGVVSGRNSAVRQNMVTAYFGADSIESTYPHIWAINTVTNVHKDAATSAIPGVTSEHYGYELDVNVDTGNTGSGAIVEGLRVAGVGDFSNWPLAYAIHVMRDNSGLYKWPVGLFVEECMTGIFVRNPTKYAALFRGNKPMSFIPNIQESAQLINVRNPDNTLSLFSVDDVGRTRVASLAVGGGSVATKQMKRDAPNVGFGNIPSGGSVSKTFVELFGMLDINLRTCVFNVTAFLSGGLPTGVFVDAYYNKANANAYVRVSNLSGSTFLNTGIDIMIEITQY